MARVRHIKGIWLIIILFLPTLKGLGQTDLGNTIALQKTYTSSVELLDSVAKRTGLLFSYKSSVLSNRIRLKSGKYSVQTILDYLCVKNNATYQILESTIIITSNTIEKANKRVVQGKVVEEKSGEAVPYALILIENSNIQVKANKYGYFSFVAPPREIIALRCYKNLESMVEITCKANDSFIIITMPKLNKIAPVVIKSAFKPAKISQIKEDGSLNFSNKALGKLPALLGEPDIFNALIYSPSVANGTEGNNGLFIRGGSPDQNLITINGAMLYNPAHFFGLFSPFNSDAINHVSMQKSGFDASIGGRLSSHVDINLKEGNLLKAKHTFSISPLAMGISSNGPIVKGKTTYLFSVRRSYFDWVVTPLLSSDNSIGFYFIDFNGKITHRFSKKHSISLSTFAFEDKAFNKSEFNISEKKDININEKNNQSLAWGNRLAQLNYIGQLSPKLFLNTDIYYTSFSYKNNIDFQKTTDSLGNQLAVLNSNYLFNSDVSSFSTNFNFDWNNNKYLKSKFGFGYFYHSFLPSSTQFVNTSQSAINTGNFANPNIYANELYAYYHTSLNLTKYLTLNTGIRLGQYFTATANYTNPQPRISAKVILPKNWIIRPSYSHMVQYLHFATNNTIGVPVDLWLPVTDKLVPETSNQFDFLVQKFGNKFNFSTELFYKKMNNLIDYAEGIEYLGISNSWESRFVQGMGETYGIDLLTEKTKGKLTGWLGYTFSFNNRQFDSINNGKKYPFKYDRRHSINFVIGYDVKKNREFYASWAYGSGAAITLPIARYPSVIPGNQDILIYGDRNANRLRDYHRLDIGYKWIKQRPKYTRTWNLSIYNLYNQQNPFYITTGADDNGERAFVQVSLLPFIPSINFKIELH